MAVNTLNLFFSLLFSALKSRTGRVKDWFGGMRRESLCCRVVVIARGMHEFEYLMSTTMGGGGGGVEEWLLNTEKRS
jgi:hypothetical protein